MVQMFGYPVPKVPKNIVEGAQGAVDLLKQKSSVAAFGAINEKVKDKNEEEQTVRGQSLRELEQFFKKYDEKEKYAGLRRIGNPEDGTALWTRVPNEQVAAKLSERTERRRAKKHLQAEHLKEKKLDEIEDKLEKINRNCCVVA